jgi:hypothetical protein
MSALRLADDSKIGKPWQDDELDAIVEDYFVMLAADLAGERYVKSRHSAALMERIRRTHRSVEFKHQNISAVLDELGFPWIPGYIPKRNYQSAIFDAIDRFLTQHPKVLDSVPIAQDRAIPSEVFVDAPDPVHAQGTPERLRRLIRKFDPVERDHRNRALGTAGEHFVFSLEQARLSESGRTDLARRVRWVAAEDGDGAGYDIFSFNPSGQERLIEVKTTNGGARTPFFLSRNERDMSMERPEDWRIYRVHQFSKDAKIFSLAPPLEAVANLSAESWRASF